MRSSFPISIDIKIRWQPWDGGTRLVKRMMELACQYGRYGYRRLTVLDEYMRGCLVIRVVRKPNSNDVLNVLAELFFRKGIPCQIRGENGSEFAAGIVRN